jgi:hypothetical protein
MDGETFSEHDYGLVITTSSKTAELEQMIKQNAQAFIQNGGTMSTIMDIYFSPSLSDMRRRLEDAEEQMHQRQSESAKAADETQAANNLKRCKKDMQMQEAKDLQMQEAKDFEDDATITLCC